MTVYTNQIDQTGNMITMDLDGDDWVMEAGDLHVHKSNSRVASFARGTWCAVVKEGVRTEPSAA